MRGTSSTRRGRDAKLNLLEPSMDYVFYILAYISFGLFSAVLAAGDEDFSDLAFGPVVCLGPVVGVLLVLKYCLEAIQYLCGKD